MPVLGLTDAEKQFLETQLGVTPNKYSVQDLQQQYARAMIQGTVGGGAAKTAQFQREEAANVHAGDATAGAWTTLGDLNTVAWNDIGADAAITSDPNGEITLKPGDYLIEWKTPFHQVNNSHSRLYNVTAAAVVGYAVSGRSSAANSTSHISEGIVKMSPTVDTVIRLEYDVSSTKTTWGLGFGHDVGTNVYQQIKITKL